MKKLALLSLSGLLAACSLVPSDSLSGTYQGTLPCADCEKIEAELVLKSNQTYEYKTVYFKRGEQFPFSESGTFSRHAEKENVIRLENSGNLQLKVDGKEAILCDQDGTPIQQNAHYTLKKIR